MKDVILDPGLWESIEAGTEALLDQWLVTEGDRVAAGQAIAKAVLVKSSVEVLAPDDGVIEQVLVPAGQSFARGSVLARLIDR